MSQRCRQSSPSELEFLNKDLIAEILSRLPVKYLMQMKCISKTWNTLISDPEFVKLHLSRSAQNTYLWSLVSKHANNDNYYSFVHFPVNRLIENLSITAPKDPYFRLDDKHCSEIVGCCNGLVCLFGYSLNKTTKHKQMWLRFWNPATRKISDKLGSDFYFDDNRYGWKYDSKFVFGYDDSTDTYKVVAVNLFSNKVRVFSLGDNVWRTIQSLPMVTLRLLNNSVVYDGVHLCCTINWLVYLPGLWKDDPDRKFVIISLDLDTETYTEMLPPQGVSSEDVSRGKGNVCVLMESLCFYHDFNETDFVVWKMTEFGDGDSWVQIFKFSYSKIRMNYRLGPRLPIKLSPLHLSKDGETLIMANNLQDQAILYNRRTNKAKKTRINKKIRWFLITDYVESLVSPS
ncbi:hypothetical protein TSUD_176000 [Trifolium subterraneum]|uniref:F-box domain-containing protein n=1 Tax=Trifolium subterraneum TaxID=3900 RepID=A0A2Z6M7R8_TRISU|nr:hypothetical protein TSUD_176000 [Trifolium subterraneum]